MWNLWITKIPKLQTVGQMSFLGDCAKSCSFTSSDSCSSECWKFRRSMWRVLQLGSPISTISIFQDRLDNIEAGLPPDQQRLCLHPKGVSVGHCVTLFRFQQLHASRTNNLLRLWSNHWSFHETKWCVPPPRLGSHFGWWRVSEMQPEATQVVLWCH